MLNAKRVVIIFKSRIKKSPRTQIGVIFRLEILNVEIVYRSGNASFGYDFLRQN
jgi:hypothetical protein